MGETGSNGGKDVRVCVCVCVVLGCYFGGSAWDIYYSTHSTVCMHCTVHHSIKYQLQHSIVSLLQADPC